MSRPPPPRPLPTAPNPPPPPPQHTRQQRARARLIVAMRTHLCGTPPPPTAATTACAPRRISGPKHTRGRGRCALSYALFRPLPHHAPPRAPSDPQESFKEAYEEDGAGGAVTKSKLRAKQPLDLTADPQYGGKFARALVVLHEQGALVTTTPCLPARSPAAPPVKTILTEVAHRLPHSPALPCPAVACRVDCDRRSRFEEGGRVQCAGRRRRVSRRGGQCRVL